MKNKSFLYFYKWKVHYLQFVITILYAFIYLIADPSVYLLRDEEAEEMYSMRIDTSLERARERKLLEGLHIYSTPNVTPPYDSMNKIVESAGGKVREQWEYLN